MNKQYVIFLDNQRIGTTQFEKSDAPMGVVMGRIEFEDVVVSPYQLFRDYCQSHHVPVNEDDPECEAIFTQSIDGLTVLDESGEDDPECEAIFTQSIDGLTVLDESGVEIKGLAATISGFKDEGYYIDVVGIPYPFYGDEFPHHVAAYEQ